MPDAHANAANAPRTPNTCNITFPGIEGEALIIALDLRGLACSTGAACSSGAVEPSHVLTAIGLSAPMRAAAMRFSLGRHTTEAEIDAALEIVPAAVAQLARTFAHLSPRGAAVLNHVSGRIDEKKCLNRVQLDVLPADAAELNPGWWP